jgi:sugar phosphate isomerase/epimerase
MHRREVISSILAASLGTTVARSGRAGDVSSSSTSLGLVVYALGIRGRAEKAAGNPDFNDPIRFLDHCRRLGAGGIQLSLGVRDKSYCSELRRKAEQHGMFVEGIAGVPQTDSAAESFDAQLRTAAQCGVEVVRTVIIPGRRYERFKTDEEFRRFEARGVQALERAEPIAARHRIKLAVENHKDQRVPDRLALLGHLSSEWVGACVDSGNSFSLLEEPLEVVRAFAPWALTVHLKDQGVCPYADGFLLADVCFGDGFLPLAEMVGILRRANPKIHFSLEMITRDPLKVPCLADSYWPTFADIPASDLARTLCTVRDHADVNLRQVSSLSSEEQVALEAENVRRCLAYARAELGLVP